MAQLVLGALLATLTLVSYLPVRSAGYIWDDDYYVTENRTLSAPDGLAEIWFHPGATPQYYPLVFTSFWLEHHHWGLAPAGYHVDNVLLHIVNALLLWRVLLVLEVPGAWLAAALFALHPVHVESVAWVTERKNVLSGAFYFTAMLAYLRFRPPAPAPPRGHAWYLLALVLFLAALLSKTVTCSLPAVLLLCIWWKRGRVTWSDAAYLAPLFALGLALAFVTLHMETHHVGAAGKEWALTPVERCLIAGRALWFYAGKLCWPARLTFIYPRWLIDSTAWWQYLFPLAALAVPVGLWFGRGRLGRGPLVAVLIFAGTLLPALGFFNVYPMRYSFVADHFQYLASAALLSLAAALAARLAAPPRAKSVAVAIVLGLLGALTYRQAQIYREAETLYTDTLAKNPDCYLAHHNLGSLYLDRGQLGSAGRHIEESIRLTPEYPEGHTSNALLLFKQGRFAESVEAANRALSCDPSYFLALYFRGKARLSLNEVAEAEADFRACLALNPASYQAQYGLGLLHEQRCELVAAEQALRRATELAPAYASAQFELGRVLLAQGRPDDALAAFQAASAQQPDLALFRYGLAAAVDRMNKTAECATQLAEARARDPRWAEDALSFAWSLATNPCAGARNGPLALRLADELVDASACPPVLLFDLRACAHAELGNYEEAIAMARKALAEVAEDEPDRAAAIRARLAGFVRRRPFRADPAGR